MSPKLSIRGLQKSFIVNEGFGHIRSIHAIERVDLEMNEGEFLCVIGPSGCGKSTLLMILAGLYPKTAGEIILHGRPLTGPGFFPPAFVDLGLSALLEFFFGKI